MNTQKNTATNGVNADSSAQTEEQKKAAAAGGRVDPNREQRSETDTDSDVANRNARK